MLTIAIHLTNHTYGACPWNRAHIEGVIEVIPAPTRVLRAIVSGAFAAGFGDTPAMRVVLQKLAKVPPVYYIPEGEYVALQAFRKDESGETQHLYKPGKMNVEPYYSYAAGDSTFLVRWSAELSEAELVLLQLALQKIHYLGRSEHRAIWEIFNDSVDDLIFNCRPSEHGDQRVQMVTPEAVDSLYIAPGVRNAELKSGMPGFYTITYAIERWLQYSPREAEVEIDSVILSIDLSYALPAKDAIYWCDKLHKALVQKSSQTEKFRNGRLTIAPLYKNQRHFHKICLYCPDGFTDAELEIIDSVERLYSNSGEVNLFIEEVFFAPEPRQGAKYWVSESPFFLPLKPSLKYGRGGRIRNTGLRLLSGTSFVKNGPEHQALKYFLRRCDSNKDEGIIYQEVDGLLGAYRNDVLLATCKVEPWQGYEQWVTRRHSGGEDKEVTPASPIGYQVYIKSDLSVRGSVTIGYGKNFGLGVLCASG
jgi:hypothetical protein